MVDLAKKENELLNIDGIDNPAILINEEPITKRSIEISKLENSHKNLTEKEIIDELVRKKVLNIEAKRLGIHPDQQKIDELMDANRQRFKKDYNCPEELKPYLEEELRYIEEVNITIEEYLKNIEEGLYAMFQRDALREYMGIEDKAYSEEYEQYIDKLVKKAKIEILDEEVRKLYE